MFSAAETYSSFEQCTEETVLSNGVLHVEIFQCINMIVKFPNSITKSKKHCPRGKPKREEDIVFASVLIMRDEETEGITNVVKLDGKT